MKNLLLQCGLPLVLLSVASCSGQKKVSAVSAAGSKIACAQTEIPVAGAHIDWYRTPSEALAGVELLPSTYSVFTIAQGQLRTFFESTNNTAGITVIPLPSGCLRFALKRSGAMSEELQKKYPGMVSLNGTDEQGADARLDFDGTQMSGQVTQKGMVYLIQPVKKGSEVYYIIYKKSDSGGVKQPFEEGRK